MKKNLPVKDDLDTMRPEYDLSILMKGGVRGKYARQMAEESNIVIIEPDLVKIFPNSAAVNRALRTVAEAAPSLNLPKRQQ